MRKVICVGVIMLFLMFDDFLDLFDFVIEIKMKGKRERERE